MNHAQIVGTLTDAFMFSHETGNERFYVATIETERLSGTKDVVPIMASEYVADLESFYPGQRLEIRGECRTHNDEQKRLHVFIFASEIYPTDSYDMDRIELEGYLCKKPHLRETPFGREISDTLLAVGRRYGKTDYIPCITWGRNARKTYNFDIGMKVCIVGRFQSRPYQKQTDDGVLERVAYEISAESIDVA